MYVPAGNLIAPCPFIHREVVISITLLDVATRMSIDMSSMTSMTSRTIGMITALGILGLTGCGGSGSSTGDPTGFLSLGVSDGPVHHAQKVCISFNSIEFKPAGGQSFMIDVAETINLLDFQGANAAPILESEELPAGDYEWARLGVDANKGSNGGAGDTGGDLCDGVGSYIVMDDDTVHNLYIPSADHTGLKLVEGFTVPVNGSIDATVEWDLMQSITAPPGLDPDVILRPTIRLVNNVEVGTLAGDVANELATAVDCEPSVYVFNDGVMPNAITTDVEDPEDPVATAMVDAQMNADGTTTYHYEIGFLLTGSYEAAFTCDGENFEPADGKPADIVAQQVTTVDFP